MCHLGHSQKKADPDMGHLQALSGSASQETGKLFIRSGAYLAAWRARCSLMRARAWSVDLRS